MERLYELKEILMDGLDQLDTLKEHKLKAGELSSIKTISSAMDHLCNIIKDMEEDGGTSHARMPHYHDDGSYRRRRSRDAGPYHDGMRPVVDRLYEAERSAASDQERNMIRQLRERMENL